ncbi:MAG: thiol-disulfide oxidoreductase DCC family protein [Terriglobales bacterium]
MDAESIHPTVTEYHFPAGWVVYDGECALCKRLARRYRAPLEKSDYVFVPLQAPWMAARLHISYGIAPQELLDEMRVLTGDGRALSGADAMLHLARFFWWARPLTLLARIPGVLPLLRAGYRMVARHRHCASLLAHGTLKPACAVEPPAQEKSRSA